MRRIAISAAASLALITVTVLSGCSTVGSAAGTGTSQGTSAPKIGGVVPTQCRGL
jgi:uncharacterized protein YceK